MKGPHRVVLERKQVNLIEANVLECLTLRLVNGYCIGQVQKIASDKVDQKRLLDHFQEPYDKNHVVGIVIAIFTQNMIFQNAVSRPG